MALYPPGPTTPLALLAHQAHPRNLGYDPDMSTTSQSLNIFQSGQSQSADSTTAAPATSSSSSPLFATPTTTASSSSGSTNNPPDVYYLVFLGVLVVLLALAAFLACRAYRVRRRYRTAAQLAIARGDPLPANWRAVQQREEIWGLAMGGGHTRPDFDVEDRWTTLGRPGMLPRPKPKRRWVKVPTMWSASVISHNHEHEHEHENEHDSEGKEDYPDGEGLEWGSVGQPLMVHSLLPAPELALPDLNSPPPATSPTRRRFFFSRRAQRAEAAAAAALAATAPPPPPKDREFDRVLDEGEPMRVAVIIQMPHFGPKLAPLQNDDDEDIGWEAGMELGVWEGQASVGHVAHGEDREGVGEGDGVGEGEGEGGGESSQEARRPDSLTKSTSLAAST